MRLNKCALRCPRLAKCTVTTIRGRGALGVGIRTQDAHSNARPCGVERSPAGHSQAPVQAVAWRLRSAKVGGPLERT